MDRRIVTDLTELCLQRDTVMRRKTAWAVKLQKGFKLGGNWCCKKVWGGEVSATTTDTS